MNTRTAIGLALLLGTAPVATAQNEEPEGRTLAELTFASIDEADKGYVHLGDMERFRASVFAGMDYDENVRLSFEEFQAWDPGFDAIAEAEGKSDALTTAKKIVFAFWDRDGDGSISEPEMRFAVNADFQRADIDGSATLTEAEFIRGFPIILAMRAAIRPDL